MFPQRKIKHPSDKKWIDQRAYITDELHLDAKNIVLMLEITCHQPINAFGQLIKAVH